jgi:hypothetical protein
LEREFEMPCRTLAFLTIPAVVAVALAPQVTTSQSHTRAAAGSSPREEAAGPVAPTPWGDPDLQGVSANTIEYRATVEDPNTYTSAWTAVLPLTRGGASDRLFEYACHEGNYAANILTAAPAAEAFAEK